MNLLLKLLSISRKFLETTKNFFNEKLTMIKVVIKIKK